MNSVRISVGIISLTLLGPVAAQGREPRAQWESFEQRLTHAQSVLRAMGEQPAAIKSVNYHVLYVCRRAFAEQRKTILEATRRNFLGFMRRLKVKINPKHEKLLVIVLDTQEQMIEFSRRTSADGNINRTVAGYYSDERNWAVFYNQRKGSDLIAWEKWLKNMAKQLVTIPGGPQTEINVASPKGWLTLTKKQLANQMKKKWKSVVREVNGYNAVVTQHEGAHQLAFNVGVQTPGRAYPFWVSEGLACLFEVPPKKGKIGRGAGRVNQLRLAGYRKLQKKSQTLGIAGLIGLKANDRIASVDALYSESWAVFAFLFHRHSKELSGYLNHLAERPAREENKLFDELAEFQQFFDQPAAKWQAELHTYVKRLK
ncbi:MAG: DUF1570 domain-containing protein [Planctomycetes bacterium]|nr:DUF1570 domain-containing protein [Planctomycetota bacterium]